MFTSLLCTDSNLWASVRAGWRILRVTGRYLR